MPSSQIDSVRAMPSSASTSVATQPRMTGRIPWRAISRPDNGIQVSEPMPMHSNSMPNKASLISIRSRT